jgi:hypothetical protein
MLRICGTDPPLQKIKNYSARTIELVMGMLNRDPGGRPTIQEVIHMDVMGVHLNHYHSHTLLSASHLMGAAAPADNKKQMDAEDVDRNIERIREELKEWELRKYRESKESQV